MATSLYDEDLCLWSETTAKLLEQKRFDEIDDPEQRFEREP